MRFFELASYILLACGIAINSGAEEIDLVYRVGGKDYLVTEFGDGLPLLNEELTDSNLVLEGEKEIGWKWGGYFSVDLDYAWPFPFYTIKKASKGYGEDYAEIEVRILIPKKRNFLPWSDDVLDDGLIVVGWVVDGKVDKILVLHRDAKPRYESGLKLEFNEETKGGYPLMWVVNDGALAPKNSISEYEYAAIADSDMVTVYSKNSKSKDFQGNGALHYAAAVPSQDVFSFRLEVELPEGVAFELDGVDVQPKALYQVMPSYPYNLEDSRITGAIELEWLTGQDEFVEEVKIIRTLRGNNID